jgi:hypothetical protein
MVSDVNGAFEWTKWQHDIAREKVGHILPVLGRVGIQKKTTGFRMKQTTTGQKANRVGSHPRVLVLEKLSGEVCKAICKSPLANPRNIFTSVNDR